MPLRTTLPDQHQLLLSLEAAQPDALIYYASPLFHEIVDLDELFLGKRVHKKTAFIAPSRIGTLDNNPHHVSFQPGASAYWRHSEPVEIGLGFDFESAFERLAMERTRARQSVSTQDFEAGGVQQRQRAVLAPLLESLRDITVRETERARPYSELLQIGSSTTQIVKAGSLGLIDQVRRGAIDEKLFDTTTSDMAVLAKRVAYAAQVNLGLTFALVEAADTTVVPEGLVTG